MNVSGMIIIGQDDVLWSQSEADFLSITDGFCAFGVEPDGIFFVNGDEQIVIFFDD